MVHKILAPRPNNSHRYAVALTYGNGDGEILGVTPIQTYPTLEALEGGYSKWNRYAEERGLSQPVKIEKTTGYWDGENECAIL